jgi:hypothetical protein
MTAQHLRDQIRQAFPATPFDGPITICDCDECTDFRKEFRHKRWDEISNAFLDFTCSPVLLTPEAFTAFLPAYMLRALDDLSPQAVVAELTIYSLCPNYLEENGEESSSNEYKMNRLLQSAELMAPEQIQAIREFLVFMQENAGDGHVFRPIITSALERVWR